MSFQLKIPHPQIKQDLVNYNNLIDDGVLVSTVIPITLDLFDTKQSPFQLNFFAKFSKSKQQKRNLDNQYCEETIMNRKNEKSKMPKLELKLSLSPPSSPCRPESPSSCVSSETSSVETASMVLVGCPRCLMYVMLPEDEPKCPKCKSRVLLDFLHNNHGDDNGDDKNNNLGNIGSSKRSKRN